MKNPYYIALLLWSILFQLNAAAQNPAEFSVTFPENDVRISGENLDLIIDFHKPSVVPASAVKGDWNFEQKGEKSMVLGGRGGLVRKDLFRCGQNQVERQTWVSNSKDLVAFRHIYTNASQNEVKLENLFPLYLEGEQELFSRPENYQILTQATLKNGRPGVITPVKESSVESDPFLIIHDPTIAGNNNLFLGAQSYYLHLFELNMEFTGDQEQRIISSVSASSNFEGVIVPPGGSRTSQWIVLAQDRDAYRMIMEYTKRLARFHSVEEPATRPYSVYCTWYYHAENYNEELFSGDIATFRNDHLPFEVFLIDDCWTLDQWGDFEANDRFPSGMKWVANEIRSAGYIPGIWTPPYLVDDGTKLASTHPEWLLKNSKGDPCKYAINKVEHFILDCTHPGVLDYLEDSYRKLSREWGFKYFKFDFMRAIFVDSDQQLYNKNVTSLEAYRMGLEALRRGVGDDAYISVCGGHYGASIGIADSQRSGSDVRSIWRKREIPKYRQNLLRTWMSAFWHVDPDAMMVRRQEEPLETDKRELTVGLFTDEEAFTNALNQFVGGGLVSFTEDFAIIDDDRKALYRHVIPSVHSSSEPLDLFNPETPEMMLTRISPVCGNLKNWNILSLMNWKDKESDYMVDLEGKVLDRLPGERFLVYDFKAQKVLGFYRKGEQLKINDVPPHASQVYKIMPWDGRDMAFVGTDLHFSSGGVEITDLEYEDNRIRGTLNTDWDYPVRIQYVVPDESDKGFRQKSTQLVPGQKLFYLD